MHIKLRITNKSTHTATKFLRGVAIKVIP